MSTAAKVSRHIPDISPTLTLRRDKAYTTYPANRRRYALPSMEVIREIEPNYAWNRLPNMSTYKSAIVRNKVCGGLMYLLPGDKNGASLARPYTADLGAMFNEPYANFKPNEYNEENVTHSSSIHFSPNTHISRLNKQGQTRRHPHNLNSESKQKYNDYNALVLKDNGTGGGKGNLPVPVKVGIAEQELQNEVQLILDEVGVHAPMEENDDADDDRPYSSVFSASTGHRRNNSSHNNNPATKDTNTGSQRSVRFKSDRQAQTENELNESSSAKRVREFHQHHYQKKSAAFRDHKELREAAVPRPKLPDQLKSKYLTDQKTEEIWSWLNWDYKKSKFEHFIEVCS